LLGLIIIAWLIRLRVLAITGFFPTGVRHRCTGESAFKTKKSYPSRIHPNVSLAIKSTNEELLTLPETAKAKGLHVLGNMKLKNAKLHWHPIIGGVGTFEEYIFSWKLDNEVSVLTKKNDPSPVVMGANHGYLTLYLVDIAYGVLDPGLELNKTRQCVTGK